MKITPGMTRYHWWTPPVEVVPWEHCAICGVIRRRDDQNGPCKGPYRVTLRGAVDVERKGLV